MGFLKYLQNVGVFLKKKLQSSLDNKKKGTTLKFQAATFLFQKVAKNETKKQPLFKPKKIIYFLKRQMLIKNLVKSKKMQKKMKQKSSRVKQKSSSLFSTRTMYDNFVSKKYKNIKEGIIMQIINEK